MQQRPAPEQYNPPLTLGSHAWRTLLCVAISALAWWEISQAQWSEARWLFFLDLAFGLLSFGLVFLRRRWPFAIAMVLNLIAMVSASSAGPGSLAFVSLSTRRRVPHIAVVGVLGVVTSQLFFYFEPQPSDSAPWINFTFVVVLTIALAATGMYVGSRRELVWTLQERARQAEAEQELRVAQAQSAERERIAREMHDVLAHRISLVAMHAGALAYRTDLPPEQVTETAGLIQTKAHEALNDLRQVLGMLRGEQGPERPQPTWGDLPALVDEARASGLTVELVQSMPAAAQLPDQVGRTVYRIVQEALTNARKHGGSHVRIEVTGDLDDGIDVTVHNGKQFGVGRPRETSTPGAGLGLIGLRERAELHGGTLHTESSPTSFTLRGWLPWPA